jgi:hypothetical protein
MGFFGFLFGSEKPAHVEVVPDRFWLTTDAKFAGLAKEAESRSRSQTDAILLVAHFPDVLARLEQIVRQHVWNVRCLAVSPGHLNEGLLGNLNLDQSAVIDMIVGERHPLPSGDDQLVEFAKGLPCRCRLSHHLSLEDPVLKPFVGDWVQSTLKQLGMSEDEAIESQMVSRRVRHAQQKIEERSFGSCQTESAAEWLKKNCRELSRE